MAEPANLPEGVTPDMLYEGAKPGENVVAMPPPPKSPIPSAALQPNRDPYGNPLREVSSIAKPKDEYAAAILSAALDVLSARLLGLLAVIAACMLWGAAVWNPDPWRIAAAGLFSVTVLGPIVALYWKAGVTGGGA